MYPFRGLIFDVDPVFANTDEWYESIPLEIRPHKDQPFYHLYAENEKMVYEAYVSEQNLLIDDNPKTLRHPAIAKAFILTAAGDYKLKHLQTH